MKPHAKRCPLQTKLFDPRSHCFVRVQYKESSRTICSRPHSHRRQIKSPEHIVYLKIVATAPPRIVMINHGTPPICQRFHLRHRNLFAESVAPFSPFIVIDNSIVRIGKNKIATVQILQNSIKPVLSPCAPMLERDGASVQHLIMKDFRSQNRMQGAD